MNNPSEPPLRNVNTNTNSDEEDDEEEDNINPCILLQRDYPELEVSLRILYEKCFYIIYWYT